MFLTLSAVPPLVRFFGALDFYTDYFWALTESPLPDAYDFIVGKYSSRILNSKSNEYTNDCENM